MIATGGHRVASIRQPPTGHGPGPDADPMVLDPRSPAVRLERGQPPDVVRFLDRLGDAFNDHAPTRSSGRIDFVDLERGVRLPQQEVQLGPLGGVDHDRLGVRVEHVVDRPDDRCRTAAVNGEAAESSGGKQIQALTARDFG